jgi:hypothetical protein
LFLERKEGEQNEKYSLFSANLLLLAPKDYEEKNKTKQNKTLKHQAFIF